ncbi:MAG TPA: thioredoxin-dependent thiol peroxidase [Acidobacteriota bacterium]|jgi:peroxiredoxin Q/BCP|nr:thioredoxin-dependent thiol peroxidase [Acidobacteriota bacterium]HRR25460.1 thioredoxin-dependent thiol peroxidase [Acidobacteriota bacterium]HRR55711.1 thioredoxin-dependent thiol peroxidase [Acidobacteriota bacterium]HRV08298.1 thioredoxin-dependent thiol peroxidase [Acidobacteriota bacterium]
MPKLKPGDTAPDFEAMADVGTRVRLSDFRGRTVILYFYPKDHTSGCTQQACSFRDRYPEITRRGAVVLGVSPDNVASHRKFKEKHDLPFLLLVDADHEIAKAYGAWGEKTRFGRKTEGIIRSHFVIGPDGVIRDARYGVKAAESADLALENLRGANVRPHAAH